ncbi:PLP-dependent transferase [Sinisalibacter aestuarii]|uniref:O-succinylhomoserine sulfhydrylase n=1 Tax=Sinisalibacter aestuarii TaxID=2949426 RepID=A0ABQ5LQG2_9RHOB|nr:PLP-dependent transferase [Sinisalibacter aestuarii]GKY87245.1 O-succinylhomoserine sulfhydrylase [Sinisalibacter aestuarii]
MGEWKAKTKAVHDGVRRSQYNEVSEAIFLTQGFVYDSAEQAEARFIETGPDEFIYARYGNPTVRMFEERLASIEGTGDGFAVASGMAAVNVTLMAAAQPGMRIVAARALFGSCLYILEWLAKFGAEVVYVDGTSEAEWRAALTGGADLVFLETISNPTLEVIDIALVAGLAHAAGALLVVDNTFSTPVGASAAARGADVVIYSTTKHIDGGGRGLGGVVLGSEDFIRGTFEPYAKHTGAALSPFNAWMHLKGLDTLDLRVRAMAESAAQIADALAGHAALGRMIYPGRPDHPQHAVAARQMDHGGTMLALDLAGGKDAAFRFLNALQIPVISNNLGDAKSIVTHPATTTHQRLPDEQKQLLGITPGLVRFSVGLEDAGDLVADIRAALAGL